MSKIKDNGFRVVGANSSNGAIEEWYFPDLEFAKKFATQTATDVDSEYHIYRHVMTVRRKPQPIECVEIEK